MKEIFVKDITLGEKLSRVAFGIAEFTKASDKSGKPYWGLTLQDSSGTIAAKVWSEGVTLFQNLDLKAGSVIDVDALVSDFRGVLQLSISNMRVLKEGEYSIEDLLATSKYSQDELKTKVFNYVSKIKHTKLQALISGLLTKHQDKYFAAPAAKTNHHNFYGGLAEHVIEMLEMADPVLESYPSANADLVRAGVIMHDIGKIKELSYSNFAVTYTIPGKLIGHIVIGTMLLQEENLLLPKNQQISQALLTELSHIILSHHGIMEYGSPVVPKTLEAIIVSRLDDMSSKVRMFDHVINGSSSEAEFSSYHMGAGTEMYLKKSPASDLDDPEQSDNDDNPASKVTDSELVKGVEEISDLEKEQVDMFR